MRRHDESGTSTLEVAGMAPLVVLVILILVQAAMALYGITTAQTAARQGARAYSQGNDPYAIVRKSVPSWMGVDVQTYGPGHGVKATVDLPDILPGYNLKVTRETVMP
ncbi:MAG: hypothetical protein QOJ72_2050 [Nocardioidaceae bacterium]|jgi:hypothetical protein|nr:hypothetical protein [Nocardioidaceae bacterium]